MRLVSAAYGSVCYHDKESFPDVISSEHRLIHDNIRVDHPRCIPADKLAKKFLDSKNGSVSRGSSLGVSKIDIFKIKILHIKIWYQKNCARSQRGKSNLARTADWSDFCVPRTIQNLQKKSQNKYQKRKSETNNYSGKYGKSK